MIVGGLLAAFPILEQLPGLAPYYFGFFFLGLGLIDFGTLFAVFSLWALQEEEEMKE